MSQTISSASDDAQEFDSTLKNAGDKLVVVDFTASWCGPCKAIAPTFESLARSNTNVVFLKVDVDQNQAVAKRYGVSAMPTFLFLRKGSILDTLRGANARFQGAGQTIGGGRSLGTGQGHNAGAQGGGILGLFNSIPRENLLPFIVIIGYLAYVILGKS